MLFIMYYLLCITYYLLCIIYCHLQHLQLSAYSGREMVPKMKAVERWSKFTSEKLCSCLSINCISFPLSSNSSKEDE